MFCHDAPPRTFVGRWGWRGWRGGDRRRWFGGVFGRETGFFGLGRWIGVWREIDGRVLVLLGVEKAGGKVVVGGGGVEAEAGVPDDALQLELQFNGLDRGARTFEAQCLVDDLSHLRHRFADMLLPVGQPGPAQFLHTYTNVTIRHQQTAPLPGTLGRITGEPRRLGKAGAVGDMVGEKLLPREERR